MYISPHNNDEMWLFYGGGNSLWFTSSGGRNWTNINRFGFDAVNQEGLENLARYIIRASFSQERMTYICAAESSDATAKVVYESKDGRTQKTFDALDWLAQLTTHIPGKGEQMVRYYGFYSNKSRGLRKKAGTDDQVPALIDSGVSRRAFRKNWARLIQKIYHVDPLLCPNCLGSMKIISFIDDSEIIKKILKHLDLWDVKRKPSPCANGPPPKAFIIYDQSSAPSVDDPPSLFSTQQIPRSALLLRLYTSAFAHDASARHVTRSMLIIRLTCRGVVRRTKTETYL